MIVTYGSLLTAGLLSTALYVVMRLFLRNPHNQKRMQPVVLYFVCLAYLLRIVLVVEFPLISTNVYSRVVLPPLRRMLNESIWNIRVPWLLAFVWAFGSLAYYTNTLVQNLRFWRIVRLLPSAEVSDWPCEARPGLRSATVKQSKLFDVPMVFGVVRPVVLLPEGLPKEHKKFVMLHEMAHIQLRDQQIKLAFEIVNGLFWWNPAIWLVKREVTSLLEMRCDERVLRGLPADERVQYLECIHYFMVSSRGIRYPSTAVALTSGVFVRRRIDHLGGCVTPAKRSTALTLACCGLCVLLFFASYCIAIEPNAQPLDEEVFSIDDNSFFVLNDKGGVDFYVDGAYVDSVSIVVPEDETLRHLPVYERLEDVPE